ncbi:probable serine/threonine-protein kinase DDB_G0282963 isoform X2 [Lucilia cuprina]|uniref:probable serine/threonine-protein kinase DDB_G0282963 isoform X2 n=1 Tax=Lucilia cuprina TaxID=7375 RepID=UPI001F061369|nr:probable serine/threonine-protein kinase DDB_G0282963 isoform X2 [Lucilia cuprina]
MGKCISKNPTSLTIALSEKDLATASHILSKFTESSEYVALKDEHRNQLCEYYAVKSTPNGGDIVVISNTSSSSSCNASQKTEQPQQEHQQQEQQRWQYQELLQQQQEQNSKDDFTKEENTCLHSLDHWTVTKSIQKQQIVNNDDKSNDAVDDVHHNTNNNNKCNKKDNNDYGDVVESMLVYNNDHADDDEYISEDNDNYDDEDKYVTIIKCSTSCSDNNNNSSNNNNDNGDTTQENIIYADINLANCNNICNNTNISCNNANKMDNNYYAEIPPYLAQLLLYQQQQQQQDHPPASPTTKTASLIDYYLNKKKYANKQHKVKKKSKQSLIPDKDVTMDSYDDCHIKGQAESKKNSKKQHNAGEIQTKGTAMSFGFRKNLNTTPKKLKKLIKGENSKHSKKQDKYNANDSDNTDKGNSSGGGKIAGDGLNTGDGNSYRTDTVIDTNNKICTDKLVTRDDNGNADLLNNVYFEKMGAAAAATIQTNQNTSVGAGGGVANVKLPGAGSRFGFRGTYRPSSTDITSRQQRESHDNIENNNYSANGNNTKGVLVSNLKRRSKSAHAGRTTSSSNESDTETGAAPRNTQTKTITFNLKQNSTIEYDRRQFFEQPALNTQTTTSGNMNYRASHHNMATGLLHHNNVIVRPTPRVAATAMATAYSKFTLQTVSLPKPEFAVAISINATTPTTPASNSYVATQALGAGTRTREHSSGRHPVTLGQSSVHGAQRMDAKQAKHMTNSTRRTFSGSREISADSGIASLDMALDSSTSSGAGSVKRTSSPKRSRSRPRNLQMVMNGRGRFEVKDLDDSLSSESSSIVEPLALPKLPAENQTVPLPLSGLIRSNTVLSRESYELRNSVAKHKENSAEADAKPLHQAITNLISRQPSEEDSESVDEEKLHLDRSATEKGSKERQFKDINTCSSKTSSPGSSVISSWCNAGESLAANDFSNLSISSSEDSNKQDNKLEDNRKEIENKLSFDLNDDDLITLNTDVPISTISSLTEPLALNINDETDNAAKLDTTLAIFETEADKFERPKSFCDTLNETKFAEMALEGSTFLLEDETSPTDSLVSSTESEEAACKQKKHKMNEELQEKDIDEISPELDLASPLSPGTPTHASHSLSLSDCGNLIDDEIADQPALLFNQDSQDGGAESGTSRRDRTDTPTLMESMGSMRASINKSRSALHQAMELSLRTPLSLRKAVMERAESLDTLSPCESICSDDLMMDFDVASSMDSIDRSASIKSRSGSDLNNIDDNELFSEFDRKGSDVMRELNSILRTRSQKSSDKDITAHLPARATRLLNRSRMQQHCTLNNDDSDSTKSPLTGRRRTNTTSSRTSTASSTNNNINNSNSNNNSANSSLQRKFSHHHNHHHHHHQASSSSSFHQRDTHSSSDDLMLYDKSFRNAMIQDVLQFKKQLLRLRKILQENENFLTRTETLNPFENDNGQLFTSCGLDSKLLDDIDLASLTSSTTDDPIQELADLRRQVVYLQGQVDDRDRTIRLQKNLIEKLEAEKLKAPHAANEITTKECVDTATQTERTRPLTIGTESLSSKPEYTSYTTYFPAICSDSTTIIQHHQQNPAGCLANNQTRRHTIISTTLTNYNQQLSTPRQTPRRASIAWEKQTPSYKPVKITLIGDPLKHWQSEGNSLNKNKDEEFSKNFINTNLNNNINKQQPLAQQENAHNNIILNSKHHHRLQDIMVANEMKTKTHHQQQHQRSNNQQQQHNNHHHHHIQPNLQQLQQQQQQSSHQFYKTTSHQHNNLKPTVTIV